MAKKPCRLYGQNGSARLNSALEYNVVGQSLLKGVMIRSMVDAFSELYSPFWKGDNSAFIVAIASGLFT